MRDRYEAGQPGAGKVFPKKVRGRDKGILMGQGRFGDGTPPATRPITSASAAVGSSAVQWSDAWWS